MTSPRVRKIGDSVSKPGNEWEPTPDRNPAGPWPGLLRGVVTASVTVLCCVPMLSASTPSLLWIQSPLEGDVIGVGGVDVMIRFPREREVEEETFVALLNGADVTSEFTTGSNGAIGRLFGVLDGENTLHFEVRGDRGGLPNRFLRDARDVRFLVRLPQNTNRG